MSIKRVKCMHVCVCIYIYVYADICVHMYAFDSMTIYSILIILLINIFFSLPGM